MKQIGSLFDKYKKTLKPPQATVEKQAALTIFETTNIQIQPDQLVYTTGTRTLKIQAPSIVQTEIMRHKVEIITKLQSELGITNAPKEIL